MITELIMPRLSETSEAGTLVQWCVKEGKAVRKGEILLEVESDKATIEIEAPSNGFLRKVFLKEGETGPAQMILALITDRITEDLPDIDPYYRIRNKGNRVSPGVEAGESTGMEKRRILASPAAVRLAKEKGISLGAIQGTGPEGRITIQDVARTGEKDKDETAAVAKIIPFSKMRASIAKSMAASKQSIPHAYIQMEVDMSEIVALRQELSRGLAGYPPADCSYTDLLIKAVALCLRDYPMLNSSLSDDGIILWKDIHVGFAVSLVEDGVIVPVIRHADQRSIEEITRLTRDLTFKAKEKKLKSEEVTGGTFTISNLGMYGVDNLIPIIHLPQSGILGFGKIARKPVVIGDEILPRPMMQMTLSIDHRVIDGELAARFLNRLSSIFLEPELLIEAGG